MKLYASTASPYVRKVLVVAHETGLVDQLELRPARMTPVTPVVRGRGGTRSNDDGSGLGGRPGELQHFVNGGNPLSRFAGLAAPLGLLVGDTAPGFEVDDVYTAVYQALPQCGTVTMGGAGHGRQVGEQVFNGVLAADLVGADHP